ncbi:MAG: D-aminoacyl-tRNA deacylase [archaeon]
MENKIVIVACEQDVCSKNIGKKLEESFEEFKIEGCPYKTFKKDDAILVWHKNELVEDVKDLDEYFKPELYVFVFRHLGKGLPRLTVHPCGNFVLPKPDSKVPYRGEPHRIAYSHPAYMKMALKFMDKVNKERELGYNVSYEVTHHTPTELKAPLMFLEIGDTEEHHNDEKAIQAIADTVLHIIETQPEACDNCIAIGGDHYTGRFTRRALTESYAFAHFIPSYAMPDVTPEVVELAIDRVVGGVKYAVFDRKGKSTEEDRNKIFKVFEEKDIELIKLSK